MELTLYKITEEQRLIESMLEETGGELTPEIEQMLVINEQNFMTKSRDYGYAILRYEAMISAIKAEKARLDGIKKYCENAVSRMEERLVVAMKTFDKPKVELDTMKLSLRKSERVVIDDETKVPADCIKVTTTVNKTDLKAHIKAGEYCGAHLEEYKSLQIK